MSEKTEETLENMMAVIIGLSVLLRKTWGRILKIKVSSVVLT